MKLSSRLRLTTALLIGLGMGVLGFSANAHAESNGAAEQRFKQMITHVDTTTRSAYARTVDGKPTVQSYINVVVKNFGQRAWDLSKRIAGLDLTALAKAGRGNPLPDPSIAGGVRVKLNAAGTITKANAKTVFVSVFGKIRQRIGPKRITPQVLTQPQPLVAAKDTQNPEKVASNSVVKPPKPKAGDPVPGMDATRKCKYTYTDPNPRGRLPDVEEFEQAEPNGRRLVILCAEDLLKMRMQDAELSDVPSTAIGQGMEPPKPAPVKTDGWKVAEAGRRLLRTALFEADASAATNARNERKKRIGEVVDEELPKRPKAPVLSDSAREEKGKALLRGLVADTPPRTGAPSATSETGTMRSIDLASRVSSPAPILTPEFAPQPDAGIPVLPAKPPVQNQTTPKIKGDMCVSTNSTDILNLCRAFDNFKRQEGNENLRRLSLVTAVRTLDLECPSELKANLGLDDKIKISEFLFQSAFKETTVMMITRNKQNDCKKWPAIKQPAPLPSPQAASPQRLRN